MLYMHTPESEFSQCIGVQQAGYNYRDLIYFLVIGNRHYRISSLDLHNNIGHIQLQN